MNLNLGEIKINMEKNSFKRFFNDDYKSNIYCDICKKEKYIKTQQRLSNKLLRKNKELTQKVKKLEEDFENLKQKITPTLNLTDIPNIYFCTYLKNEKYLILQMKYNKYKIICNNHLEEYPFWVDKNDLKNFESYEMIFDKSFNNFLRWDYKKLTQEDMYNIYKKYTNLF